MALWEVANCPNRPSDLMGMVEDGYSTKDRLRFDMGIVGFARKFERRMQETEEKQAPKPKKTRMIQVLKNGRDVALRWLGVDAESVKMAGGEILEPEVEEMVDDLLSGKADWLHNPGG